MPRLMSTPAASLARLAAPAGSLGEFADVAVAVMGECRNWASHKGSARCAAVMVDPNHLRFCPRWTLSYTWITRTRAPLMLLLPSLPPGLSFHITSWTYMIPMSLGTAANTRVANALGAGSPASARRSAVVALLTAVATQLAISATLFLGRHSIARVFTQEEQVRAGGLLVGVCAGWGLL